MDVQRGHRRSTIEDLAQRFVERCAQSSPTVSLPRQAASPSDFPLAQLSQDELDEALGMVEFEGDMQDEVKKLRTFILYLPCNRMLFHSLFAPASGVYIQQPNYELHGNLDISAFERAWQVVDRHPILRTAFVWELEVDSDSGSARKTTIRAARWRGYL